MFWAHFVEEIELKLEKLPPQPWSVSVDVWSNSHIIIGPDKTVLLSVPIPERKQGEADDAWGFRISDQFQLLSLLVLMVNHSGIWFEALRLSDVIPKKPNECKTVRKKETLVIPENPEVFSIAHLVKWSE